MIVGFKDLNYKTQAKKMEEEKKERMRQKMKHFKNVVKKPLKQIKAITKLKKHLKE